MQLYNFKNIHKDKSILILGKGSSLNLIPNSELKKCITIGVNDIEEIFIPDYLLFQDNLTPDINKRKKNNDYKKPNYIQYFKSNYLFLHKYNINIKHFTPQQLKNIISAPATIFNDIKIYNNDNIYFSLSIVSSFFICVSCKSM